MIALDQQDRIDIFAESIDDELFLRIVQTNFNGEQDSIVIAKSMVAAFASAVKRAAGTF